MSLATATTDASVVDGLVARVTSFAAAGKYGGKRRQSFGNSRSGRRNLKRLEWGFRQCLAWYRVDGREKVAAGLRGYEILIADGWPITAEDRLAGEASVLRGAVSSYLVSMFAGWLLSIVAGWLFELIVDAFMAWILSEESAAFRAAAMGK